MGVVVTIGFLYLFVVFLKFLVVVEIVFDVVGIRLIDLCQQFRGDDTNPVMLDRY